MHAIAEIIIPPTKDIKTAIGQVMDYFKEEDNEGEKTGNADWWDFWVIGGRFSGHKVEARIGKERLEAFYDALKARKVTVSGFRCGKQELQPASQIPMVDALWREMFPGFGDKCILFNHARDQYGKEGEYRDDICAVSEIPESLECERFIVAGQHWDEKKVGWIEPKRMWAIEYWNMVEHQKTGFDGKVKAALAAMMAEDGYKKITVDADWLCVTVDYHN